MGVSPLIAHYLHWSVLWCLFRGRHKGTVGYINDLGAYWMCDNCGAVLR